MDTNSNTANPLVSLSYIEAEDVAKLIKKDGVEENHVIIDVRDEDEYDDGHIVTAANFPSSNWNDDPYVRQIVEENVDKDVIVVHCFYSQQRGPRCARILADNLERYALQSSETAKIPKIRILRGGYKEFSNRFDSSQDLFDCTK